MGTFVTIVEFSDHMKVHRNTTSRWIDRGMPVVKLGGVTRIDLDEAIQWLKDKRVEGE